MSEIIRKEEYKNHTIKILQDEYYDDDPNKWDENIQLVNYHRDFEMTSEAISEDEVMRLYQGEKIPQEKKFFIFPVSMLSHSGVCLSLESGFSCDSEGWDTSHVGLILISKDETTSKRKARKIAEGSIKLWNDLLSGNVYMMKIINTKTEEPLESYGGYIGDIDVKNGIMDKARSIVDSESKRIIIKKCKKTKALISNKVSLLKRS